MEPGEAFRDCAACPEMIPLPPGDFTMGRDGGRAEERPAHRARIDRPFALARTETTYDQYMPCVEAGLCKAPRRDRGWGEGDRPVIYVDWEDAVAYTRFLTGRTGRLYRLPTEAEWEYAARAGGAVGELEGAAGLGGANCRDCMEDWPHMTVPVASLAPNALGLYDMIGNVMEWTASCWRADHLPGRPEDCGLRVRRGGSWYFNSHVATPTYRYGARTDHIAYDVGFRVAAEVE